MLVPLNWRSKPWNGTVSPSAGFVIDDGVIVVFDSSVAYPIVRVSRTVFRCCS